MLSRKLSDGKNDRIGGDRLKLVAKVFGGAHLCFNLPATGLTEISQKFGGAILDFINNECRYIGIILKVHRTLLCPLITTKIERIPPFEKGGLGGI